MRTVALHGQKVFGSFLSLLSYDKGVMKEETPEPLREWMMAIADSLNEESQHDESEIVRRVFRLIEEDVISPKQWAKVIQSANRRTSECGFSEGIKEGRRLTAQKLLGMGMDIETVCEATALTDAEVLALLLGQQA